MIISGTYFDGKSARGHSVKITKVRSASGEETLHIAGDSIDRHESISSIDLSPRLARTRRQLRLAGGGVCDIDDDLILDQWFANSTQKRWNLLAYFEAHWIAVSLAAAIIIALAGASVIWAMPWAAQKIAQRMPQEWVDQLGTGALFTLDKSFGSITHVSMQRRQQLHEKFSALAQSAGVPAKFSFRAWPELGANALALPDSTIVLTDQLVELAEDDRELLAVVAHELGHEHERHALQQILNSSGVAGLIFVLTGDVSGLANIVVVAPTVLTHMHHSRALEREADLFAFALLQRNGIEPHWFARAIRKLETSHRDANPSTSKSSYGSWLSTHPDSEARALEAENYHASE